jgi:hypothetical protein
MRVLFAMLADVAVGPPDGKVYILGGGVEILKPPVLPFVVPAVSFVAKIEFTTAELGRPRVIEVVPLDSDGQPLGPPVRVETTPVANPAYPGLPVSIQLILNMRDLPVTRPQSLAFSVLVDGHELASVPLHIVAAPTGTTQP